MNTQLRSNSGTSRRNMVLLFFVFPFIAMMHPDRTGAQGIYNFYGLTSQGGPADFGTIYSTSSSGTNPQTRFTFPTTAPGSGPGGTLIAYNGKLYGTAGAGGANFSGVLFEYDPLTATYTKKADFDGSTTGAYPQGSLVLYNGKLYGNTASGGANSNGEFYEYDPATNTLTGKADFDDAASGGSPYGSPMVYNGKLYGTASSGGVNSSGTIYEFDPATNALTDVADFNYSTKGSSPQSRLIVFNSKLYGTATSGGANGDGTLFEYDPVAHTLSKIADFSDAVTGSSPTGSLAVYNGKFYGMAAYGGLNSAGTVYEFNPVTAALNNKADFDYSNGATPDGAFIVYNNKLYAVTNSGGNSFSGTLVEYDPVTATLTRKADLDYSATGSSATGDLLAFNNKLYGLAGGGGLTSSGTLFEFDPVTNALTKDLDFNANLFGATPYGSFTAFNGKLYGTTSGGGAFGAGTIFEYDPVAGTYTKKADFDYATTGANPHDMVTVLNGKLYGMTTGGGLNSYGTLFEYDLTTGVLSDKADFDYSTTGAGPEGGLTVFNNKLYGMVTSGGANGYGTLIEFDPATGILTDKVDLDYATTGFGPQGSFIVYNNQLYGLTNGGGVNSGGTILAYNPTSNALTAAGSLTYSTTGAYPVGSLIPANNKFYAVAREGGANGSGTIFSFDPATTAITKLADLNYTVTGALPSGELVFHNGKLYGTAEQGGANFDGTLFEFDTATAVLSVKTDFDYTTIGARPKSTLSLVPARPAPGTANNCESEAAIAGTGTGWLPMTNSTNDAVAEINPNGNNLGTISVDLYTQTGTPVRENASHKLFLDRNVTISPATQPLTPVDVRIYISDSEFVALKNAVNSLNQPSNVNTYNDLVLFKSSTPCSGTLPSSMTQLATTVAVWPGGGYVLSASVPSLSTFFVGGIPSTPLPMHLVDINAANKGKVNEVTWNTALETGKNTMYLERSANGREFYSIATITGKGNNSHYSYTDADPIQGINYYRLRMVDEATRETSFSTVVTATVKPDGNVRVVVYPNPVGDQLTIEASTIVELTAELKDVTGVSIRKFMISNGRSVVDMSRLPAGVYLLTYTDGSVTRTIRIVK